MESEETRQRFLAGLLIVIVGGVIGWRLLAWWSLPPAVEFDNLKYIQLLTTAVSSRSTEMVGKVDMAVQKRFDEGQMSDREWEHFQELFALAKDAKWDEADRKCFEFAEAQLSRSRDSPPSPEHSHDHAYDSGERSGK